jgi:hypothetical protein
MNELKLNFGFKFEDLFESGKLKELTEKFYGFYEATDKDSFERFKKYRIPLAKVTPKLTFRICLLNPADSWISS